MAAQAYHINKKGELYQVARTKDNVNLLSTTSERKAIEFRDWLNQTYNIVKGGVGRVEY